MTFSRAIDFIAFERQPVREIDLLLNVDTIVDIDTLVTSAMPEDVCPCPHTKLGTYIDPDCFDQELHSYVNPELSGQASLSAHHDELLARLPLMPRVASSAVGRKASKAWAGLYEFIEIGSVLSIRGSSHIEHIGETGGLMGHVLLATSRPICIDKQSPEASAFHDIWPQSHSCVWQLSVIESTRAVSGLFESDLLLYVDAITGHIVLFGETRCNENNVLEVSEFENDEKVEVWRCPPDLRAVMQESLMLKALDELKVSRGSWSWATAVRAYLFKGEIVATTQAPAETMAAIRASWDAEPICTTVVIAFWQRYLCSLVEYKASDSYEALDLILKYLPVKADRALPSELFTAMRSHRWEHVARVPTHIVGL